MTWEILAFMAGAAVRSAAVVLLAAFALAVLRIRDAAVRSAVWTAMLIVSISMPVAALLVPRVPLLPAPSGFAAGDVEYEIRALPASAPLPPAWEWSELVQPAYFAVALLLLARVLVGLLWGWRLRNRSRTLPELGEGVCESPAVAVPMTFASFIVLPDDWRTWTQQKLDAVLAHENAHRQRRDWLVNLIASVHCAVFWFSPVAWWLRRELAATAEQASDDRALHQMQDNAAYAEVLLGFLGKPRVASMAVPMARGASATQRIERILAEGRKLSLGVRGRAVAGVAVFGFCALYLGAAVSLAQAPPPPPPPPPAPPAAAAKKPMPPPPPPPPPPAPKQTSGQTYVNDKEFRFQRDGVEYRIEDQATLELLRESNREMAAEQRALAERHRAFERRMRDVEAESHRSAAGTSEAQMEAIQMKLAQLHRQIEELHREMAARQQKIGERMAEIGEQQAQIAAKEAEAMARIAAERGRMLEQAIKEGKAKPVK